MTDIKRYTQDAVELLEMLISKPSISRDETLAAEVLEAQMNEWGLAPQRIGNNIVAYGEMAENRPTLLLNAHIDTVKPVSTWTRDPYKPSIEDDRLYGLGANDCGGGQMLICVGGRGYYQEWGGKPVEMVPGTVVNIPANVKQ